MSDPIYEMVNGKVREMPPSRLAKYLAELAAPPKVRQYTLGRAVLFERLTDEEAELLDGAISKLGARSRHRFSAAAEIDSASDLFAEIYALAEGLFGAERTADVFRRGL